MARELVQKLEGTLGETLAKGILGADQSDEPGIHEQRMRVGELKKKLARAAAPEAVQLLSLADSLVKKSV